MFDTMCGFNVLQYCIYRLFAKKCNLQVFSIFPGLCCWFRIILALKINSNIASFILRYQLCMSLLRQNRPAVCHWRRSQKTLVTKGAGPLPLWELTKTFARFMDRLWSSLCHFQFYFKIKFGQFPGTMCVFNVLRYYVYYRLFAQKCNLQVFSIFPGLCLF